MHLFRYISLFAVALFLFSCSSGSTLSEEDEVDLRQPMVFGLSAASSETEVTRASVPLTTNFRVSTWKSFGLSAQQTVMDGYDVEYTASATPYQWNYVGVNGQIQRYWDLGAFPYEFRAVAPYLSGASITTTGINIDLTSTPFRSQQLINDSYANGYSSDASVQPCVVAHVDRVKEGTNYVDHDKIKDTEINTVGKADATREVHMPFHHLNSKIGFRIYIDNPQPERPEWQDDYRVWIDNITITVQKQGSDFITAATGYSATNAQGLLNGTFTGTTTHSGEYTLLSHNAYQQTGQNLHLHLNRETAFDMTPLYLQQIPQQNLKIHVTLTIHTNHVQQEEQHFTYDTWLSLDRTNSEGDIFTWEPDYRYIYYLHIPNLHGHKIYLNTCEVLPWDVVQTDDIDVGM